MLLEGLQKYFSKDRKKINRKYLMDRRSDDEELFSQHFTNGVGSESTQKTSFKASDMAIYRLLSNSRFEIGDTLFRSYIKLIFALLEKRTKLKKGGKVYLQIDFTSERDHFLILVASVLFSGKAIPLI